MRAAESVAADSTARRPGSPRNRAARPGRRVAHRTRAANSIPAGRSASRGAGWRAARRCRRRPRPYRPGHRAPTRLRRPRRATTPRPGNRPAAGAPRPARAQTSLQTAARRWAVFRCCRPSPASRRPGSTTPARARRPPSYGRAAADRRRAPRRPWRQAGSRPALWGWRSLRPRSGAVAARGTS
ncbi:hypothetical protein G6F59_014334 [Rhizopus arrhizus]|nr:hypothetical protein G6F59_014334 [Rhizopus arrhizus]